MKSNVTRDGQANWGGFRVSYEMKIDVITSLFAFFTTSAWRHLELGQCRLVITEPPHDKTNKMICAPSEDSDQPGHPPNLIRRMPRLI